MSFPLPVWFIANGFSNLTQVGDHINSQATIITALQAHVKKLEAGLKEIIARDVPDYEPDCEYWVWGNYDDAYSYGVDTGDHACAKIARAALEAKKARG